MVAHLNMRRKWLHTKARARRSSMIGRRSGSRRMRWRGSGCEHTLLVSSAMTCSSNQSRAECCLLGAADNGLIYGNWRSMQERHALVSQVIACSTAAHVFLGLDCGLVFLLMIWNDELQGSI